MLQSSNQYLRPDYLTAPNALDTKSSPLALLAQTCSAIGADTTNPKLLAANIEKATKAHHKSLTSSIDISRDKLSPLSSHSSVSTGSAEQQQIKINSSSFKPYESNNNHLRLTEMMANQLNNVNNPNNHNNAMIVNNNGGTNNHNYNLHHQQHQQHQQHHHQLQQQQHLQQQQSPINNGILEHTEQATNLVTTTTATSEAANLSSNQRMKTPKINVNNMNVMMGLAGTAAATNMTACGPSSNGMLQQNGQTRCDSNQSATSQRESPATIAGAVPLNGNLRRPSSTSSTLSNNDLRHTATASPGQQQQHLPRSTSKESPGICSTAAVSPNTQQHLSNHHHSNSNSNSNSKHNQHNSHNQAARYPSSLITTTSNATSNHTDTTASTLVAASKEASYVKALHAAASNTTGTSNSPANHSTTNSNNNSSNTGSNSNSNSNSNSSNSSGSGGSSAAYYQNYAAATGTSMPSYPMDLMAAGALMSPHHPLFKAAALNPYLNYARLKGGLDMNPNICRDPYCTGCPANPHFLHKAAGQPCPAGCPQCERESMGKAAALAAAASAATAGNSNANAAAAAAAVAASSYHAQLAALAAASQMPYVCSWIGGDTPYCGKRFATSDELFQHLRTHTASLPDSVLSAAAAGGIPPNHPLFSRTYPTPPLSPLSAARYHPYGKPSMLPPSLAPSAAASLAGLQMPPHHALAQYFSPYSLYGPRMGSSHP